MKNNDIADNKKPHMIEHIIASKVFAKGTCHKKRSMKYVGTEAISKIRKFTLFDKIPIKIKIKTIDSIFVM